MTAQIIPFPAARRGPKGIDVDPLEAEKEQLRATPKWRKAFAGPDSEWEREILRKAQEAIAKLPRRT